MKAFCLRKRKKNTPQQQYVLLPLSHYSITTSKKKLIRSTTISVTVRTSRYESGGKSRQHHDTSQERHEVTFWGNSLCYCAIYSSVFCARGCMSYRQFEFQSRLLGLTGKVQERPDHGTQNFSIRHQEISGLRRC
jgi:hypothetical protein